MDEGAVKDGKLFKLDGDAAVDIGAVCAMR